MEDDQRSTIAEIIRDLLIFVAVITALLIALVVVISKMPDTNPLKRILTALSYRSGHIGGGSPSDPSRARTGDRRAL